MSELPDSMLIELLKQNLESPALAILFDRYRPVLQRVQSRYYLPDFDQSDWEQEALLVMCGTLADFDSGLAKSFGAYFRLRLVHRVFDLIRQSQAKKRQVIRQAMSIEKEADYFADTLPDQHWYLREQLEAKEAVYEVLPQLSPVEHAVFSGVLRGESWQVIAQRHCLSQQQVRSASHRSQAKLRELLAE